MKHAVLLIALVLMLPAIAMGAIHCNKQAPALYSVFDSPPGRRLSPAQVQEANRQVQPAQITPPGVWRTRGIVFTSIGGAFLVAAAGVWLYADAESRRQAANGGHVYTLPYYGGAILLGLVGLVFSAIGLPIWLSHLHSGPNIQ